mgnify:CR=1 FL=1
MSDPRTKAERSKAKDIRQGVVEQRSVGSKGSRKMAKVFRLTGSIWHWNDRVIGKYTTLMSARKAYFSAKSKGLYRNLKLFDLEGEINMEDATPPKEYPDE